MQRRQLLQSAAALAFPAVGSLGANFAQAQSFPARPIKLLHMGDIPADPAVRQAIMRRQLLLLATPSSPAALAIGQLALKIEDAVITRGR